MRTESSYGWLVAPDPAARARLEAELQAVYVTRGPEPGLPEGPSTVADLETHLLVARYVSNPRPLFSRLPFDYRLVPGPIRTAGLALLDRLHAGERAVAFPHWPSERRLDDLRASLWAAAAARSNVKLEPPDYPGGRRGAVLLTHDIDSRREIAGIADLRGLERRFDLPSSIGFIPDVSWPDRQTFDELLGDGLEIYCHDVSHDGKLPYKGASAMQGAFERFFEANAYARPLVRGFRSGQLLMTAELLGILGDWFKYDLSLPDTERGGPYGSVAGCASVYPFLIDGLLEIPLTMPQDFFLANVERYNSAQMLAVWRDKLELVLSNGGVAVLNTHPVWTTPNHPGNWTAYEGLLATIAQTDAWVTTPSSLHEWLVGRRNGIGRQVPSATQPPHGVPVRAQIPVVPEDAGAT